MITHVKSTRNCKKKGSAFQVRQPSNSTVLKYEMLKVKTVVLQ